MKKVYFMSAVLAGMLAMTGCSNDELATVNEDPTDITLAEGEGLLTINLTNTGIGTRAARPLGSSAAANNVNNVQLKFYTKSGGTYSEATGVNVEGYTSGLINNWTATEGENAWNSSHDDEKTVKLTGLQASTEYMIVAYGYNTDAPTATDANGVFTANNVTSVEEVFAGKVETTTTANGKFSNKLTVEMDRQVAGMLAYMKGVPTHLPNGSDVSTVVAKVVVKANAKSTGFTFPSDKDFNGVSCTETSTTLLTFDMSKIASNWNSGSPTDNMYSFTDAPYAEEYTTAMRPNDLELVANSIFGACYLLPYDQHYDQQTLTIELQDKAGTALATKNVVTNQATGGIDKNKYDIRRNNFYSIGKKLYSDNTGGDPDPDPDPEDPDPDTPVDLSESDEVLLIINDAWDVLHNMTLE